MSNTKSWDKPLKKMLLNQSKRKSRVRRWITVTIISALMFMPFADNLAPRATAGSNLSKVAQQKSMNAYDTNTSIADTTNTTNTTNTAEAAVLNTQSTDKVIKKEDQAAINNAVKISFCGDLILLADQIKKSYNNDNYNFDHIYKYTSDYIKKSDLAIGVLEGCIAGSQMEYSTGNYDGEKDICLNYPDEYASSLKNAGFDLITTASDHLLDKGIGGASRTLDVLDAKNLEHVGSYRNQEEKDSIKIVQTKGLKIAVLAYTYGIEKMDEETLMSVSNSHLTSIIVSPDSPNFSKVKQDVKDDFERAKKLKPDMIVVLPHMGKQRSHETDNFQKTWNNIFVESGADIVFSDHAQAVQPIEFVKKANSQKNAIIVNSAGSYSNIYRQNDSDANALVEVYVDQTSKKVIAASVVPMWIQYTADGNYQTVPIYTLMTDSKLLNLMTSFDRERISQVQELVTKTMLGTKLGIEMISERFYMTPEGFVEEGATSMNLTENDMKSQLYSLLTSYKDVCFVGDSITAGSKNGGYGWYEPISFLVKGTVSKKAIGGSTTKTIFGSIKNEGIPSADLYVVAIGTNDIRYRNADVCAMTQLDYIVNLSEIVGEIRKTSPKAQFAFVAPWMTLNTDTRCVGTIEERKELYATFSEQLKSYCKTNGFSFIDPNSYIKSVLDVQTADKYLVDYIHPNAKEGIKLYAMAALSSSLERNSQ